MAVMRGSTFSLFTSQDVIRLIKRKKAQMVGPLQEQLNREQQELAAMRAYFNSATGQTNTESQGPAPDPAPMRQVDRFKKAASAGHESASQPAAEGSSQKPPLPPPSDTPQTQGNQIPDQQSDAEQLRIKEMLK